MNEDLQSGSFENIGNGFMNNYEMNNNSNGRFQNFRANLGYGYNYTRSGIKKGSGVVGNKVKSNFNVILVILVIAIFSLSVVAIIYTVLSYNNVDEKDGKINEKIVNDLVIK
jgi:hypothetical protein